MTDFFWKIISDADQFKDELVTASVKQFAKAVKYDKIKRKLPLFDLIVLHLRENKSSCVPPLKLFRQLIEDHHEANNYIGNKP